MWANNQPNDVASLDFSANGNFQFRTAGVYRFLKVLRHTCWSRFEPGHEHASFCAGRIIWSNVLRQCGMWNSKLYGRLIRVMWYFTARNLSTDLIIFCKREWFIMSVPLCSLSLSTHKEDVPKRAIENKARFYVPRLTVQNQAIFFDGMISDGFGVRVPPFLFQSLKWPSNSIVAAEIGPALVFPGRLKHVCLWIFRGLIRSKSHSWTGCDFYFWAEGSGWDWVFL